MFNMIINIENATLFYTPGVTHTWSKPSGFTNFFFIISGGGGGGGSGALGGDRAAGGGGGGGSGAHICFLIPASSCPNNLYISLGAGGVGGTAPIANGNGVVGNPGGISQIALSSLFGTDSIMVCNGGGGGSAGNTTGAAGGGTGGTATAVTSTRGFSLIPVAPRTAAVTAINLIGDAGTAGGNATAEQAGISKDISNLSPKFIFGGTGGGSVGRATGNNFLGGSMTNSTGYPWIATPSVATGTKGSPSKIVLPYGFFVSGGVGGQGGGSSQDGGDGLFGAGGGGGGAAWTGTTTHAGGRGGDGFVLIKAL